MAAVTMPGILGLAGKFFALIQSGFLYFLQYPQRVVGGSGPSTGLKVWLRVGVDSIVAAHGG